MGKLQGVEALDSVLKSELRALKISCFPEHVVSFGFFCCCWQLWHFILLPCSIFLFFFFGVIPNCIFHYATIGLSYETLHPVLVNPPTPSHVKLPFPYPPQCASCTHSFTLKRDTWTFRGWQRASSLQINRNTCGLWKWGFLCYCFTKWPLSPKFILFNASHPPPPATHTYFDCTTQTPCSFAFPSPSAHTRAHTLPVISVVCGTDGGVAEVMSALHVCLVHSKLTHSPMSVSVATTVPVTVPQTHLQLSTY